MGLILWFVALFIYPAETLAATACTAVFVVVWTFYAVKKDLEKVLRDKPLNIDDLVKKKDKP